MNYRQCSAEYLCEIDVNNHFGNHVHVIVRINTTSDIFIGLRHMTYLKHKPFYIFHKLLKQKQNKKKHLKKKTKKHIT